MKLIWTLLKKLLPTIGMFSGSLIPLTITAKALTSSIPSNSDNFLIIKKDNPDLKEKTIVPKINSSIKGTQSSSKLKTNATSNSSGTTNGGVNLQSKNTKVTETKSKELITPSTSTAQLDNTYTPTIPTSTWVSTYREEDVKAENKLREFRKIIIKFKRRLLSQRTQDKQTLNIEELIKELLANLKEEISSSS